MRTLWLPEGAVHGAPLVAGPTSVAGSPVVMVLVADPTSVAGSPVVMVLVAVRWSIWCWVPLVATGRWSPLVAAGAAVVAGRRWPLVPLVAGSIPSVYHCMQRYTVENGRRSFAV